MNEIRRPGGLVQRCIVIHRDENGFGLTVSGDNPVYVQSVKEKSAAARSGVQVGDQIIKVNGTVVTQSNHIEVVRLIKSGSFVALTLLGKDSAKSPPENRSSPRSGHTRSRSLGNNLAFHALPPPANATQDSSNERTVEIERMLNQEREFHKKVLEEYMRSPSQRSQQELAESQTRINALEHQLRVLTGNVPVKSPGFTSQSRQAFRQINDNPPWSSRTPPSSRTQSLSSPYKSTGAPSSGFTPVNNFHPREGIENQSIQEQSETNTNKNSISSPNIEVQMSKMNSLDQTDGPPYSLPPIRNYNDENSFDSLFMQAQQDNLMAAMPIHSAASVISMEDDEFEFENEKFDNHGPFIDLTVLKDRPAHLAVFLHFLMSNSNPSPLFFWLVTGTYTQETGHVKDLKKWAYEIYSTFVADNAPLKVEIGKPEELAIEDALDSTKTTEDRIRSVFSVSRQIIFAEVNEQLADFRSKRALGLGGLFGDHQLDDDLDRAKELKVIEQTLLPHLEALMADMDSPNESQNNRNIAMSSALATFMKQVGLSGKVSGNRSNHVLDRCRSFAEKEKKSFISGLNRNRRVHTINGHSFVSTQYSSLTLCNHCNGLLWGIGTQGYQCSTCEFNVHKRACVELLTDICPGSKKKSKPNVSSKPVVKENDSAKTPTGDETLTVKGGGRGRGSSIVDNEETKPNLSLDTTMEDNTESGNDSENRAGTPSEENQGSISQQLSRKALTTLGGRRVPNIRDLKNSSSTSITLPGANKKNSQGYHNGVYGPTPFNAFRSGERVESPPPESEEEEDFDDSDLEVEAESQNWQNTIKDTKMLRKLKNKEVKRQEVIHELVHTERTHVRNLKVLNKVFYRPLLRKNILPVHQVKLIFPNLEELIEIHESLLKPMKFRSNENEVIENIGDLMLERFDCEAGEKVKEACAKFCRGQKNALEQMKKLLVTKKEFQQFMQNQETHPLCRRLKFTDIIASTHQRLVKYPMLLEGINKATPPPHGDYLNVEKCTKCCKDILNYVNSEIAEAENKLRLEEMSKKIEDKRIPDSSDKDKDGEGKFDITTHKMLYEGSLVWKINPTKRIDLHVILLTDYLVLLQRQDDRYILKTHSTTIGSADNKGHSPIIKVTNIIIREVATDKKAFFLVSTSMTGPHIYELLAHSTMEKRTWTRQINEAAERVKGRDMFADRGRRGGLSIGTASPSLPSHREEEEERLSSNSATTSTTEFESSDNGEKPPASPSSPSSPTPIDNKNLPSKERMLEISEELASKDKELKKVIDQKNKLLAELQGSEEASITTLESDAVPLEPRDLVLAAIGQADRLTAVVSEILTINKDSLPEPQRIIASESTTALYDLLTSLLDSVQSRENQMRIIKDGHDSAKATIARLKDTSSDEGVENEAPQILIDQESSLDENETCITPTPTMHTPGIALEEVQTEKDEDRDRFDPQLRQNSDPPEVKKENTLLVTSPFKILRTRASDSNLGDQINLSGQVGRAASFSGFSSARTRNLSDSD